MEADVRTFRRAPHAVRLALAPLMRANVGALLLMIRAFMGWVRYLSSLVEDLRQEVPTLRPTVAPSAPVALAAPAGVAGAVADDEEVGGRRLSTSFLYLRRPL